MLAVLAFTALLYGPVGASATTLDRVGFETVVVPNGSEPALNAAVWYPTNAEPTPHDLAGNTQSVALRGPIRGQALGLVVISHGGGGTYAGHYDTAVALARAGFVVAAVSHAGDDADDQSRVLEVWRRPAQLKRLISFMLTDWRGHPAIDARRIGAFGFSNGGFTVLVAAGGVPDLARITPYCRAHADHDLCRALSDAHVPLPVPITPPVDAWRPDPRVRAVVAAAPAFGFTFDRAGLARVHIPVQLWQAADDQHQPRPYYEEPIRNALPQRPDYHVIARAGHYAFLPPCAPRLASAAPMICTDPPGFDRAAMHRRFNAAIVRFFKASLKGANR